VVKQGDLNFHEKKKPVKSNVRTKRPVGKMCDSPQSKLDRGRTCRQQFFRRRKNQPALNLGVQQNFREVSRLVLNTGGGGQKTLQWKTVNRTGWVWEGKSQVNIKGVLIFDDSKGKKGGISPEKRHAQT